MEHIYEVSGIAPLPQDHGYLLLSALSAQFPFIHGRSDVQISPLTGHRGHDNLIHFDARSKLRIRGLEAFEAKQLVGKVITVAGSPVFIGRSRKAELRSSGTLTSRLVVFKGVSLEEGQLDRQEFVGRLLAHLTAKVGPHNYEVTLHGHRCLKVKQRALKGLSVTLTGLTPRRSLAIQRQGLGHGTSMGCGVFRPPPSRAA